MNFPAVLQNEAAVGSKGVSCSVSSHASEDLEAALVFSLLVLLLTGTSCSTENLI